MSLLDVGLSKVCLEPRLQILMCCYYFVSYHSSSGSYSIITAKVRRDLLESQKKYTKNKYCKYNDFKKCSKGKHILRRGFERRYCSIPINV